MLNIVFTIVIFQLLLLSIFLLTVAKGKKTSNRILGLFFLFLALNLGDGLLVYYGFYEKFPALAHFEDGFVFLFGPLLYFYTCSVIYREWLWRRGMIVHLLPFVLFTVAFQLFYQFQSTAYQKMVQDAILHQMLPPGFYFSIAIVYVHVGSYVAYSFLEIKKYRMAIRDKFSAIGQRNLEWLSFMLTFFAVLLALSFFQVFIPLTGGHIWLNTGLLIIGMFFFVFVNGIVWKALSQPALFSGIEFIAAEKYSGSTLTENEKLNVVAEIDRRLQSGKFFLDPELTIDQLANTLNISSRKLSRILNEHYQQNFFDFINTLRIGEAVKILESSTDPKLTVLEVMYQAGFNSKSSFNVLFRKKTGQTPSEFRKARQKRSTS